jgi:hypothetical protein
MSLHLIFLARFASSAVAHHAPRDWRKCNRDAAGKQLDPSVLCTGKGALLGLHAAAALHPAPQSIFI